MPKVTISKRRMERAKRADALCQEFRLQIAEWGRVLDPQTMFKLWEKWSKVVGKDRYRIPKGSRFFKDFEPYVVRRSTQKKGKS